MFVDAGYLEQLGFAETLELLGEKSECKRPHGLFMNLNQSLLSPRSFSNEFCL
jgi:hypothetical protein